MRVVRTALMAGVAAVAVAGFSGWAHAQSPQVHVMTVQLPGGGVDVIRYTGDVPPQVVLANGPAAVAEAAPLPSLFGPDSPFAELQRISAAMDRQAATLMQQTAAFANAPLMQTDFANLPPGTQGFSFVSTMSGNGVCTQSVEITQNGNGAPHVVRHSSGNCGPTGGAGATIDLPPAMAPQQRPGVIMTKANGAKPYAGLVHEIPSWQQQR